MFGNLVSHMGQHVRGVVAGWLREIIVNDALPGLNIVQTGAGYGLQVTGFINIAELVLECRYLTSFRAIFQLAGSTFGNAGRAFLIPIDVPWPVIADRIIYGVGAVAAGNVRCAIYREGAAADSPAGGELVIESGSVAQPGAEELHSVVIADTLLIPGQYFLAIQGNDVAGTYFRSYAAGEQRAFYYDIAGGYGSFTDPCPAVVVSSLHPYMKLRVKENLPAGSL